MSDLNALDEKLSVIVGELYRSVPFSDWTSAKLFVRYSPGGAGSLDFEYTHGEDASVSHEFPSDKHLDVMLLASLQHWRLTQKLGQPRWYMMTVKLDRDGKYSVDFEYRDDYQEGDIMKPLW